ncbi:metalloprotease 1 [Colletotrichum orchidophilum]|uniref:Metalloprotease 1 n=1 Tax=Colletotrichum orchidophilum TaxID=1209926 RepID=A0A1G4BN15_9PEZI|nr:metalloprotease 1 [Colletotrichum orchidophilum]OHF02683.1 metalloprotease 1 [Colletotrichum orchidophilum]
MVLSCFLLLETSPRARLTADIIPVPPGSNAQAHIETIRTKILENTSKRRRFFNKYVLFQKPSVWIARLRPVTVHDLSLLPPLKALVQNTALDETLSEAINDPDSPEHTFYNHMYALYDNVFTELDEQNDTIVLPQQALLVRYETSPRVKRVFAGVGSVIGGLAIMAVKLGEGP